MRICLVGVAALAASCTTVDHAYFNREQAREVLEAQTRGRERIELQHEDGSPLLLELSDWKDATLSLRTNGAPVSDMPLGDVKIVPGREPLVEAVHLDDGLVYRVELSRVEGASLTDTRTSKAAVVAGVAILVTVVVAVAGVIAVGEATLRNAQWSGGVL